MAVKHGTVGEFNSDQEDRVSYTERLVQYFIANSISEEGNTLARRAILLSSCGAPTYQLIRNLVAPDKPTDKSFTEMVALVRDHHQPHPVTKKSVPHQNRSPGPILAVKTGSPCQFWSPRENMDLQQFGYAWPTCSCSCRLL